MDKDIKVFGESRKFDGYLVFKRLFDIVLSCICILLFSPLFIIISIIVKFDSKGNLIYKQERVKKNKEIFNIYKFRTMRSDSLNLKDLLSKEEYEEYLINYKLDNDPRITKIGKYLREFSLDELPQLINVLKGDMSIIGPRPIVYDELKHYANKVDVLLSVKPGITGYWQVNSRNEAKYDDGKRQQMELYYIYNQSFILDCKILIKTFIAVVLGSGK